MEFFSILFQSVEQEQKSMIHPWMRFTNKTRSEELKYVMSGNKFVAAQVKQTECGRLIPVHFIDLNLDQILDAVLFRDMDEPLRNVYYHMVSDESLIIYRQEIMRDLECEDIRSAFNEFLQSIETAIRLKEYSDRAYYPAQRDKYSLDSMALYCQCIQALCRKVEALPIHSQGLKLFTDEMQTYAHSERFRLFSEQVKGIKHDVEQIRYQLHIIGDKVELCFEAETTDYTKILNRDLDCTARWGVSASIGNQEIGFFKQVEMCSLEVKIMDLLQARYASIFQSLNKLVSQTQGYMQHFIMQFCKDVKFYLCYIDYMLCLKRKGFTFSYPIISGNKTVLLEGLYDMALAYKADTASQVVSNDFMLHEDEASIVITGANQGGKTTFARSFGQIAALTALGLPVSCKKAILPLYHEIYTQFSEKEDSSVNNGKLKEELIRLKPILDSAGKDSLVILNELFSSTTAWDAFEMGSKVLTQLTKAGAIVLCVTHIPELADACKNVVSMVAQIQETDGKRMYIIKRAHADGLAHASALAAKHRLTYVDIKERIGNGV